MNHFDLSTTIHQKVFNNLQTFLIIGAFDGLSHDTFFEKINNTIKKNKQIIFVEPVKKSFDKLINNISLIQNANISCEQAAVSDIQNEITVVSVKEEKLNSYPWYINGCSCVVENNKPINIYMKDINPDDCDFEQIQTITFKDLVSKYKLLNLDYLQIDTEGYDQRILDSIDFSQYDIRFLKFELHYLSDGWLDQFISKMEVHNYLLYKNHEDCYLIKEELYRILNES